MGKPKRRPDQRAAFVTTLPIESCIHRLETLADADIRFEYTYESPDSVLFRLWQHTGSRLRSEVRGQLRRWEGTLTRVDYTMQENDGIMAWVVLIMLYIGGWICGLPLLMRVLGGRISLISVLLASAVMCILLMVLTLNDRFTPFDDVPEDLINRIERALR